MASHSLDRARKLSATSGKDVQEDGARPSRQLGGRRRVTAQLKLPIALKFATLIAILTVASMAWLTWTAIRTGGDQLEKEINELGIHLVSSATSLLNPAWLQQPELEDELQECLERFCASAGTDKMQAIVVYAGDPERLIAKVNADWVTTEQQPIDYPPATRAQVRITEFESNDVPVRSFSKSILLAPGALPEKTGESPGDNDEAPPSAEAPWEADLLRLGRVDLFLTAKEIEDSRRALSSTLTKISLLACLVAAVAAFLLASYLTRPIRTLMRDVRKVSTGNLQHQSSVNSGDELGDLARAFNVMTSNLQTAQAAKLAKKAMEHELSIATSIQQRLLPATIPTFSGIDLATFYLSAKEVGGDYYDFVPVDDDHLGIVVADVSGKGVPGSLVMTMTRSLLRLAAAGVVSPADTVRQVNSCLTPDMNPGMFVTLLYAVLNTRNREVRLVRAGHNPPLLYSARHDRLINLKPSGIAIGLDHSGALFQSELEIQRFTLQRGDVLVAYTDGVVEGKDPLGADFGDERLARLVKEHHEETAQEIVDAVVNDLNQHQEGTERSDDITLLAVKAN